MIGDLFYIFGSIFVVVQYIRITNKDINNNRDRIIQKSKKLRHNIQDSITNSKDWEL